MSLNKIIRISLVVMGLFLFAACSNEKTENKSPTPQQNIIDSLALVKENKAIETSKLKHELDSLKKHLDSIKAISIDSSK